MADSSFNFADWPPTLTDAQRAYLTQLATTYALSHGLLYLPLDDPPPPAPTSAIHAPLSLFPAPFPRRLFENAVRLQKIYNVLYARIALDEEFLDKVMGEEVAPVDEFTGQLWRSWRKLRDEGIPESLHLGIFRSDYLLHAPRDSNEPVSLKQVEFNTISSSFGALSDRASGLHNYLLAATGYFGASPHLKKENFPPNKTTSMVADGLAAAHKAYGVKEARILFVVQPGERNVFDQRWIEYELLERHNIHVIRQTFDDLLTSASLTSSHSLFISAPLPPTTSTSTSTPPSVEISVIYYRAGYTPKDYPSPAHYALRETLSRSKAINCPTLALQLAGGKKVQQVLTKQGILERFLQPSSSSKFGPETFTDEDLSLLRSSWVSMWCLSDPSSRSDSDSDTGFDGISRARISYQHLVLKPQREGGGNNVYHSSIPSFLSTLPEAERAAWIAMRLIEPPVGVGGYLVRAGSGSSTSDAGRSDVVSELGVFGWALFGGSGGRQKEVVQNNEEGEGAWLVRTKGRENDEGGVAVGFSVLDSVLLVN